MDKPSATIVVGGWRVDPGTNYNRYRGQGVRGKPKYAPVDVIDLDMALAELVNAENHLLILDAKKDNNMDRSTTPSLRALIGRAIEGHANGMRVALPGEVVAYDPVRQSVDVMPLIQNGYIDENGERQTERVPIVLDVPLAFPGAGLYRITFPVAVGDHVLLVFCSSSITRWKLLGGEVDPGDDRRHDLNDSIAIPGIHDFAHVPTTAPTNAMVLHADQLKLGGPDASQAIILGDVYRIAENTLFDAISTFAGAVPGATVAAATLATALTAFKGGSYLSTKIKAE